MIGKTILHYEIQKKLGEGGMGIVYLAQDTKLERQVAIKFLPQYITANADEHKRFEIEAKAAAALNHPNIAIIHAIEEADDETFLVMEYIEGNHLKDHIESERLPVTEVIEIAKQIAKGLQAAHKKGIIHRDIKSSNIMITDDRKVKIMDFGLAKVGGGLQLTKEQSTLGTVPYMSPEQLRGDEVDQRTDIWSFGVVLYEMLSGRLPFKGEYEQAVSYAIINEDPQPLPKNVLPKVRKIVAHAMDKNPQTRYQSVDQILADLKNLEKTDSLSGSESTKYSFIKLVKQKRWIVPLIVIPVVLILLFILIPYYQLIQKQQAKELIPQINTFINERNYYDAFKLARKVDAYLAGDPEFEKLKPLFTDYLTVTSEPPGATVYLKRYDMNETTNLEREKIGITPITNLPVVRGGYKVYFEKEGFVTAERVFSSNYSMDGAGRETTVFVNIDLLEQEKNIRDMVFVPGESYTLVGWDAPTSLEVELNDYFIDKYEVSNNDFKQFIDAGGYIKKQYWKYPFENDGKKISWDEGMQHLTDKTGLHAPRNWTNQRYPKGYENHPVTDITWYEAAAYAEFAGKKLPTIFQWEKAARNGEYHVYDEVLPWGLKSPNDNILRRANFEGNSTENVKSYEFGISPFGCYNMAGNVKEWCFNRSIKGFYTTGGSWQDPVYMFANFGAFPSFYSSGTLGFRCVKTIDDQLGEDALNINLGERIPTYKTVDENTFKSFLTHFRYDKKELNPQIMETTETSDWVKQKISFAGRNNEQILAFIYLPQKAKKPYQCINWIPHGGVIGGTQSTDEAAEYGLAPHIKAGRALFVVVPEGAVERPREENFSYPDIGSVRFREMVINYITDFRRGLDYLETRDDIDRNKLAFLGTSWGSTRVGVILAAIESRYRSVVFLAGGMRKRNLKALPEVNMINYVPFITPPKILINGKYDEAFALDTEAKPFYDLMRGPKKLVLFESGHVPPMEKRVPVINKWLDDTLGAVNFEDQ